MKNKKIDKITTIYVPEEDRIMVSGELSDGGTVILWFTQRLLKILIPNILRRLTQIANYDEFSENDTHKNKKGGDDSPVDIKDKGAEEWLVTSVDIANKDNYIILTFKRSENNKINFVADEYLIHRWLEIIRKNFEKADWNTENIFTFGRNILH